MWNEAQTLLLIDLWKENEDKFTSGAYTKKSIWIEISKKILNNESGPSHENCVNKWKSLVRTYRKIKDNNNKSGRGNQTFKYYDAIDNVLGKRPENVNVIGRASSINGFQNAVENVMEIDGNENNVASVDTAENNSEPLPKKRKKSKTPEWFAQLNEAQEKRHKENLAEKKRACDAIERLCEKLIDKI